MDNPKRKTGRDEEYSGITRRKFLEGIFATTTASIFAGSYSNARANSQDYIVRGVYDRKNKLVGIVFDRDDGKDVDIFAPDFEKRNVVDYKVPEKNLPEWSEFISYYRLNHKIDLKNDRGVAYVLPELEAYEGILGKYFNIKYRLGKKYDGGDGGQEGSENGSTGSPGNESGETGGGGHNGGNGTNSRD